MDDPAVKGDPNFKGDPRKSMFFIWLVYCILSPIILKKSQLLLFRLITT